MESSSRYGTIYDPDVRNLMNYKDVYVPFDDYIFKICQELERLYLDDEISAEQHKMLVRAVTNIRSMTILGSIEHNIYKVEKLYNN